MLKKFRQYQLLVNLIISANGVFVYAQTNYYPTLVLEPEPINSCVDNIGLGVASSFQFCQDQFEKTYQEWQVKKSNHEAYIQKTQQAESALDGYSAVVTQSRKKTLELQTHADNTMISSVVSGVLGTLAAKKGYEQIESGIATCGGPAASCNWPLIYKGVQNIDLAQKLFNFKTNLSNKASQYSAKANEMQAQYVSACTEANKMTSTHLDCKNINAGNGGFYVKMISDPHKALKNMFDSKTQDCKAEAPQQCPSLLSALKNHCQEKINSCLDLIKKESEKSKLDFHDNGIVSTKINGKSIVLSKNLFDDPQDMMNAGFAPAQVQSFFKGMTAENKRKFENFKKYVTKEVDASFDLAFLTENEDFNADSSSSKLMTKIFSDESQVLFSASEDVSADITVRSPSSFDFQDLDEDIIIGTFKNNLFQMVKNRYYIKLNQSSFIEP